jgi:hypothetical protein
MLSPAEQLKPHPNKLPFQLLFCLKVVISAMDSSICAKNKTKKLSFWVMLSSAGTIQHLLSVL